jgi:hypothetical protein
MEQTVYARVDNDKIIEYPVYEMHIRNRAHPFDWYKKVVKPVRPVTTIYQYVKETLKLAGDAVAVEYTVVDHGLEHLFSMMYNRSDRVPGPLDGTSFGMALPVTGSPVAPVADQFISTAPEGYMDALTAAVDKHVSGILNDFAKSSGFDSVVSLVSYKDSTVPEWASMANDFIVLRDLMWTTCITMQNELRAGAKPVPKTLLEFATMLPELKYSSQAA